MPYNAGYVSSGYNAGYGGAYTGGPILTAPATIVEGNTVTITLQNVTAVNSATLQGEAITLTSVGGGEYTFTAPLQNDNATATLTVSVDDLEAVTTSVSVTVDYQNKLDLVLITHGTPETNSILYGVQFASTAPVEFEVITDFDGAIAVADWQAVSDNAEWLTDVATLASFNIGGTGSTTATLRYYVTDTEATGTFDVTLTTENAVLQSVTVPANATYTSGTLSFTLTYSEAVNVTGTPRLALDIGGTVKYADYASGTGTTALVFEYGLESGLQDLDGIEITALQLNGGTIKDVDDLDASTTLPAIPDMSAVLVDTKVPQGTVNSALVSVTQPAITGSVDDPNATIVVSPGSVSATNNGDGTWTLAAGSITALSAGFNTITATFTDQVGQSSSASGIIEVESAGVVVTANDLFTLDTTPVVTGTVSLVNSVVKVTAAGLTYNAVVSGTNWSAQITASLPVGVTSILVEATAPNGTTDTDTANITVQDVRSPVVSQVTMPVAGIYTTGDTLQISVQFDEVVVVTGVPQIPAPIGANTRNFDYVSGTVSQTLVFEYTVVAGDEDLDGFSVNSIQLSGGTIRDQATNDAILTFIAVPTQGVTIVTQPATISIDAQTTINSAPIITGTNSDPNAQLTLKVGGITYSPATESDGSWEQQIGSLPVGQYGMTLDAVNAAGLASTQASATLNIELPEEVSDPIEPDRLSNAITLLKRRLGRYTDNPNQLDDFILDELVAAQNRLENKTMLPWFLKTRVENIQTTPGQDRIVLPYNWLRLREDWERPVQLLYQGQWRRIGVYSYDQLWDNTSSIPDVPTSCAQDGRHIVLGPPPKEVYQIKLAYYKKEFTLVEGKVVSNAWLKYAFDLLISEAGFILANNYLKNQEATAQFAAEVKRAEEDLRMTNIAYEVAAMESWELNNGR